MERLKKVKERLDGVKSVDDTGMIKVGDGAYLPRREMRTNCGGAESSDLHLEIQRLRDVVTAYNMHTADQNAAIAKMKIQINELKNQISDVRGENAGDILTLTKDANAADQRSSDIESALETFIQESKNTESELREMIRMLSEQIETLPKKDDITTLQSTIIRLLDKLSKLQYS